MDNIVIHPGLPKVATTSLQNDFYPNLKDINYVGKYNNFNFGKERKNLKKKTDILRKKIYCRDINAAKKIVSDLITKKINLFSFERWYHRNNIKEDDRFLMADRLHAIFPNAKIIIGVREKKSLLMSWYKEAVKCGYPYSFITYANTINMDLLNWREYVGYMEELYGCDRVFVYSLQDLKKKEEETLLEMANFIGVPANKYHIGKHNIGYGKSKLTISLHLNKLFKTKHNPHGVIPWNHVLPHSLLLQQLPIPEKRIDMEFLLKKNRKN